MHNVYFRALDFETKMSYKKEFIDFGYLKNISQGTKDLLIMYGGTLPGLKNGKIELNLNSLKLTMGETLRLHTEYLNKPGGKAAWIYYVNMQNEVFNLIIRAHEEAHAICYLGHRKSLEKRINEPNLNILAEEDFCDQAGLYVIKKKGLTLPKWVGSHSDGKWDVDLLEWAKKVNHNNP